MDYFKFLVFILCLNFGSLFGIQFNIDLNKEKCLRYDFENNDLVSGNVEVNPIPGVQLSFKINDVLGNLIHENRDIISNSQFAFTALKEEEYSFCFKDVSTSGIYPSGPRLVTLNVKTNANKIINYEEIAKRDHLQPIELEARKIEDLSNKIRDDFQHLMEREYSHRDTSESTNSRVAFMSGVSLFILAALGIGQIYYLRTYFKAKKLI